MNILVVDDEKEIADLMELYLTNEGFTVYTCYTGLDALKALEAKKIDLALLDVMLPDMDGFSICRRIREGYRFPVIMLTAKVEELDKITGLSIGADDYITKPFSPLEVVARVKAQLRRATRYNEADRMAADRDIIDFNGLIINRGNHGHRFQRAGHQQGNPHLHPVRSAPGTDPHRIQPAVAAVRKPGAGAVQRGAV